MFYRIRQFIKAITAQITSEEEQFYKQHLSEREIALFKKLRVYDQKHSIEVAKYLKVTTHNDEELIRIGLLHDIGKQIDPLNPIEKAVMVILDKLTKGKIEKYKQLKMVRGYYEHPEVGYMLLKAEGIYEEPFLQVIRCHHMKGSMSINKDRKLALLQEADDHA